MDLEIFLELYSFRIERLIDVYVNYELKSDFEEIVTSSGLTFYKPTYTTHIVSVTYSVAGKTYIPTLEELKSWEEDIESNVDKHAWKAA